MVELGELAEPLLSVRPTKTSRISGNKLALSAAKECAWPNNGYQRCVPSGRLRTKSCSLGSFVAARICARSRPIATNICSSRKRTHQKCAHGRGQDSNSPKVSKFDESSVCGEFDTFRVFPLHKTMEQRYMEQSSMESAAHESALKSFYESVDTNQSTFQNRLNRHSPQIG